MSAKERARARIVMCVEYVAGSDGMSISEAAEWVASQEQVVRDLAWDYLKDPEPADGGPTSGTWLPVFKDWVRGVLVKVARDGEV
jgi:hypothetical protein